MDDKKVKKEIKESLLKHTNSSSHQKEEIWGKIESRLKMEESGDRMMKERKRKRKTKSWLVGTAAAAILVAIVSTTTTGQAFVENIKEYFAPEKQVVEEIEGMPEEQEIILNEGGAGYIIYIDEKRYKLVEEGEMDKIVPREPLGDLYPDVSMTISQIVDQSPGETALEVHEQLIQSFDRVNEIEIVHEPVDGLLVSAIHGTEWDSPVTKVYIVSNEENGSFVIRQNYFLEAAEGHGTRFYHMLKEFKIVARSVE